MDNVVIIEQSSSLKSKHIITARETEYLVLAALGLKNTEIAKYLCVSKFAVKKTLENIFRKLMAKNRTHAVTLALLHNLISFDSIKTLENKYLTSNDNIA